MIEVIAGLVVLLSLSVFFSIAETGLTSVRQVTLQTRAEKGDVLARIALRLLARPDRYLATLSTGVNIAAVATASVATTVVVQQFGDDAVIYSSIAVTAIIIVFGEVVPKTFAAHHAERAARWTAPAVQVLQWVFLPVVWVLSGIARIVLFPLGVRDDRPSWAPTSEELQLIVDEAEEHPGMDPRKTAMLGGVLDLENIPARAVMIPRPKIDSIGWDEAVENVLRHIVAGQYTRYPVYRGRPENIVGVLHAKDLLTHQVSGDKRPWHALLRPAVFLPETTRIETLLHRMKRERLHIAFVVDEYGDLQGMLTLEDVLEEIVGDILDEHDAHEVSEIQQRVKTAEDGSIEIDGQLAILDANRLLEHDLPADLPAATVGGLAQHLGIYRPGEKERVTDAPYYLEVIAGDERAVQRVRLIPVKEEQTVEPT